MYKTLFLLLGQVYGVVLRPLLIKAVQNPDEEWDDIILQMIDGLFGYTE